MADKYKVLCPTGLDYPDPAKEGTEKHVKAGVAVDDLPEVSIGWLVADGHIQKVEEKQ